MTAVCRVGLSCIHKKKRVTRRTRAGCVKQGLISSRRGAVVRYTPSSYTKICILTTLSNDDEGGNNDNCCRVEEVYSKK